jgi:hypothetical protein
MMITTQRLLDLTAAAQACHGEDLLRLLREANGLYQQGLQDLLRSLVMHLGSLPTQDLVGAAMDAGMLCDTSQGREELLLLLALAKWEMTPAALAYSQLAEDAARRGISLTPED